MGGYQRTSTLRLFDLLFLASAASAVSLSSFKLISSNGLPLPCVIAYNTPISGCLNNDFITGNTCSSICIAGIETTEALIKSACDQVDPGDNTILILAMNDRLVDALCPNNGGDGNNGGNGGNGGDDDDKTTTTARVTTSSARSTTTSIGRFTTISSSSTRSTSSTSSTPFAADPPQSESTTKSTSTISKSTTSVTSLPGTTGDVLTVTSTASSSRSTTTTSAEAAQETDPLDNGGGGSPFDDSFTTQFSAANPGYQVKWWPTTLAAVFAVVWVLVH